MRHAFIAACSASIALAGAAAAQGTESILEFDTLPPFTDQSPGGFDVGFARYEVGGVEIGIHASGAGFEGAQYPTGFVVDGRTNNPLGYIACGNNYECGGFVATFSTPLEGARVDFNGIEDFSGAGLFINSSGFFLQAYSEVNGTGDLLGSATIPSVPVNLSSFQASQFFAPASLSIDAPAIRSIVFGATTIHDQSNGNAVNLARVDRIHMNVVPEPGTALLVGLGLIGISAARRKSR